MADLPKYLLLAQKTFRELADRDVVLDPQADLADIQEIIQTARRVLEPTDPALARRLMAPVVTLECGETLECLPLGVQEALWRVVDAGRYTEGDVLLAQAYAATHAQDTAFWQRQHSPRAFLRTCRRWAGRLNITAVEIAAALRELAEREYAALQPVPGGGDGIGWIRVLEILVRDYGHDTDYWTWTATTDEVDALLCAIADRQEAEERELMKATKPGQPGPRLSPNQYQVRSMDALIRVRDRIAAEQTADRRLQTADLEDKGVEVANG